MSYFRIGALAVGHGCPVVNRHRTLRGAARRISTPDARAQTAEPCYVATLGELRSGSTQPSRGKWHV